MFMLSNIFCYVYLTIIYFLCLCAFQLFFFLYFSLLRYLVYFMELLCLFTCFILLYLIVGLYGYCSAFICDPYYYAYYLYFMGFISAFPFVYRQNSLFSRILTILYQCCGIVYVILHCIYLIT